MGNGKNFGHVSRLILPRLFGYFPKASHAQFFALHLPSMPYLLGDFGAHLVRVVCKALSFRFIKALFVAAIAKWSVFCETTRANKDGLVLGNYFNWTSCVEADNS